MSLTPLNIELRDFDLIIQKLYLEEIKTPLILDFNGELNPDGLFSEKIFGNFGSSNRVETFGYIKLKTRVLHPFVYSMFKKLLRSFDAILLCQKKFVLSNGKLRAATAKDIIGDLDIFSKLNEEPEDSEEIVDSQNITFLSGYDLVINNFKLFIDYLKEEKGEGITKGAKKKLGILEKFSKHEVFIDKWLVIPAAARDINLMDFSKKGIINYEPINDKYVELLRITNNFGEGEKSNSQRFDAQIKLQEIHDFLMKEKTSGKTGLIRSKTTKKAVANAIRGVISHTLDNSVKNWNSKLSNNIATGYIGVPVTMLISAFYSYYIHHVKKSFEEDIVIYENIKANLEEYVDKKLSTMTEVIEVFLDVVIKDNTFGFKPVKKITNDLELSGIDFLKNVSKDIVGTFDNPKKFMSVTRYPVTNVYSTQYLAPIPYTTNNVKMVGDLEITEDIENYSTSVLLNQSSYTYFGADNDGDTISMIGVYNTEANKAIKEKAWFRIRHLDVASDGGALLQGNECLYGLYVLTK
jgi:DNA-directed RNA polymerase beta' subunit